MPLDEIRSQRELNLRVVRGGDIVGLHHLPAEDTIEGITMVLNAGLIPELKGPEETALGRKQHPKALIAQSVDTNELLAAVGAGANVLVASKWLSQEEISAARYEASKKGKFLSIIVGIDPTAPNIEELIHLAVISEVDGIKFKPAGKKVEKTNKWIDFTKNMYPELLLMVAGGVKSDNRHVFQAKAGIGADTVDEINAVIPWATKNITYHLDIVAAMQHAIESCSGWHGSHKKTKLKEHLAIYFNSSDLMTNEKYMKAIRTFIIETIQERQTWKSIFQAHNGETKSFAVFYNFLTPRAKNIVAEALECPASGSIDDFRTAALSLRENANSSTELPIIRL